MGNLCSTPPKSELQATRSSMTFGQNYKGVMFEAINGDIVDADVEAIVNGSNQQLTHNNGIANSLVAKGGQVIQEESDKIREEYQDNVPVGSAVVTSGGRLKAKHIIHVITPVWNAGANKEDELLAECVVNAMDKANQLNVKSIAVPSLDGGVLGFPKERAAEVIVQTCIQYIDKNAPISAVCIKFVNTDSVTVKVFKTTIQNALMKKGGINADAIQLAREDADGETKEYITQDQVQQEAVPEVVEKKEEAAEGAEVRPVEHHHHHHHHHQEPEVAPENVVVEENNDAEVQKVQEEAAVVEEKQQEEVVPEHHHHHHHEHHHHQAEEAAVVEEPKQEEVAVEEKPVEESQPAEEVVEQKNEEEVRAEEQVEEKQQEEAAPEHHHHHHHHHHHEAEAEEKVVENIPEANNEEVAAEEKTEEVFVNEPETVEQTTEDKTEEVFVNEPETVEETAPEQTEEQAPVEQAHVAHHGGEPVEVVEIPKEENVEGEGHHHHHHHHEHHEHHGHHHHEEKTEEVVAENQEEDEFKDAQEEVAGEENN